MTAWAEEEEEEEDDSDLPEAEGDEWEDVPETHLSDEDYESFVEDELSGADPERASRRIEWVLAILIAALIVTAVLVLS